jgi:sulfonate transport system permease protein
MTAVGLFEGTRYPAGPSWIFRTFARAAVAAIVLLALLLLWTASARRGWLPPQILPPPLDVWQSFADLAAGGELLHHTTVSLLRVIYGFAAGAGAGLLLGTAMGLSPTVEDYVKPLFTAIAQVPTLGWIPLLMLLFGIDETLKIVIIAKAAFVPVTINAVAGIGAVPRALGTCALCRFCSATRKSRAPSAIWVSTSRMRSFSLKERRCRI